MRRRAARRGISAPSCLRSVWGTRATRRGGLGACAPAPLRYAVGIGAALIASFLRIALNPVWGTSFPYIFFFPATLFTALYGGAGPAWAGIAVCAVMTFVWVLPPTGVPIVSDRVDVLGLMVYVAADGVVAWIGAGHRALIAETERQHIALAEREESLSRAEAASRRLAAIVESPEDAIIAKTVNGIITAWNSGATRLFGHDEREAVGQSIELIVPSDRRDEEAELRRRVVRGEAVTNLGTVRVTKHGEWVDVAISVSPIRDATVRSSGRQRSHAISVHVARSKPNAPRSWPKLKPRARRPRTPTVPRTTFSRS
jgi:PAS domain S-box-containing protein